MALIKIESSLRGETGSRIIQYDEDLQKYGFGPEIVNPIRTIQALLDNPQLL